jgi:hypothetical protein
MVQRGADELASFAQRLHGNDLQGVLSEIERFARRQPALFTGAAIAAGFALARAARIATEQAGSTQTKTPTGTEDQDRMSRTETTYPGAMYHG